MTCGGELLSGQPVLRRLVFEKGVFRRDPVLWPAGENGLSFVQEDGGGGSLILAPRTCLVLETLEIVFAAEAENVSGAACPARLRLVLGEGSRLTLVERHEGLAAAHVETEIVLKAGAKLVHGKIVLGHALGLRQAQSVVRVAAGAFYDHFGFIVGGAEVRCEKSVTLEGEGAEAKLSGAMLLRGDNRAAMVARVRHLAPCCQSRQICKAVLTDEARGLFHGAVFVAPEAQKTDAGQVCRALLLSDKAEMEVRPELEIYADDVKCGHGAAVGDLDENALFYLLSRGIEPKRARALLIEAFIEDIMQDFSAPVLASATRQEVKAWLA